MRDRRAAALLLPLSLALALPAVAQPQPGASSAAPDRVAVDRIRADVTFFASPPLKGRRAGSPEGE
ncbi:MAG TPA: hypothetical protein PLB02_13620, partial [Thermoanaerobaculia bacterium]|nr:hypothetical protein [Thermoanaerobaculia bacterium]